MRRHGRIVEWHGERGFGFVLGDDDGERAFAHVIDFTERGGMPTVGDHVSYEAAEDEPGRTRATNIRYAEPAPPGATARTAAIAQGRHVNGLAVLLCLAVLGAGILQYQRLSAASRQADPRAKAAAPSVAESRPSGAAIVGVRDWHDCAPPRVCTHPPACSPARERAGDCPAGDPGRTSRP